MSKLRKGLKVRMMTPERLWVQVLKKVMMMIQRTIMISLILEKIRRISKTKDSLWTPLMAIIKLLNLNFWTSTQPLWSKMKNYHCKLLPMESQTCIHQLDIIRGNMCASRKVRLPYTRHLMIIKKRFKT